MQVVERGFAGLERVSSPHPAVISTGCRKQKDEPDALWLVFFAKGGDVGNRTRVRKIRPANVYERSRSFSLPRPPQPAKVDLWLAAGTRKSFFRMLSDITCGTLALCRPGPRPAIERCGWTWSLRDQPLLRSLMQRGAE
jgi:hypothetical protein